VLDVGQCNPDHAAIRRLLTEEFGVEADRAYTPDEAWVRLQNTRYDLVLVNRIFDATGEEGLAFIRRMKTDTTLAAVPVMLVSNYADAQAEAVAAGAEPGFGKATLEDLQTSTRLATYLQG
jgi:two-component system chemotaxis response regulator CheY